MEVYRLTIEGFRGFDVIEIVPRGHVLLVGEPRAGRSDALTALTYVLDPDAVRGISELDFHNLDTTADIQIEVTLGGLGNELEQRFLDQLEFWDPDALRVLAHADDPSEIQDDAIGVVRLACTVRWDEVDERPVAIVYWVKFSDPENDDIKRVSREDRLTLPFVVLGTGRPLNLAPRGGLRAYVDKQHPGQLADAVKAMAEGIDTLAAELADPEGVAESLEKVLEPLRPYLGVTGEVGEVMRFLPEGGTVSGLLRSLAPAFDLDDDAGHLPLARHGSTTSAQFAAAEAVATAAIHGAVVAVDDFGDSLDLPSAQRLGALLRSQSGQVWLSTRRPETALRFEPQEIVRLARQPSGITPRRTVHYGRTPATRGERVAARELDRQVLPAMTARALVICEGPHDRTAYEALAERLDKEHDRHPPEAFGVRVIDAGSTAGGIDKVARVAEMARDLGFRVVALIDYDRDETQAASRLAAVQQAADIVVRLPKGIAIEKALLEGLDDADVVSALMDLSGSYSMPLPAGWQNLNGGALTTAAVTAIKSNNGLHGQLVEALLGPLPPLATTALEAALECARGVRNDVFVQL